MSESGIATIGAMVILTAGLVWLAESSRFVDTPDHTEGARAMAPAKQEPAVHRRETVTRIGHPVEPAQYVPEPGEWE